MDDILCVRACVRACVCSLLKKSFRRREEKKGKKEMKNIVVKREMEGSVNPDKGGERERRASLIMLRTPNELKERDS